MKHKKRIRTLLLAGLVVWLPILVTVFVIRFIVDLMDGTMALLPVEYQPDQLLGFHLPGVGLVVSLIVLIITGIVASNFFGKKLVKLGESILSRIPLVRSIYNAVKQVMETLFSSSSDAFRRVLLIEYPRKDSWSIGFQTGTGNKEVNEKTGQEMVTVFIPTTPNPTSGYLLLIPKQDAIELDMSIDEALKLVISLGVVNPNSIKQTTTPASVDA